MCLKVSLLSPSNHGFTQHLLGYCFPLDSSVCCFILSLITLVICRLFVFLQVLFKPTTTAHTSVPYRLIFVGWMTK